MSGSQSPPGIGGRLKRIVEPVAAGLQLEEEIDVTGTKTASPSLDSQPKPKSNIKTTKVDALIRLPERVLWTHFARIRELHRMYPSYQDVTHRYIELRDTLFEKYRPDIDRVVRNYCHFRMPQYSLVDSDDLFAAAYKAHSETLEVFDPSYGDITYMQFFNARRGSRLGGAIKDALRALQEFPRPIAKMRREISPMMAALRQKLGHKPSPEEFCDEYGWEEYEHIFRDHLFWAGVFNQQRLSTDNDPEGGQDELELLVHQKARADGKSLAFHGKDVMAYILSLIEDRDINYIIWAYYSQGDTNEKIAKALSSAGRKCSVSLVVNKHLEGLRILEQKLDRKTFQLFAEQL